MPLHREQELLSDVHSTLPWYHNHNRTLYLHELMETVHGVGPRKRSREAAMEIWDDVRCEAMSALLKVAVHRYKHREWRDKASTPLWSSQARAHVLYITLVMMPNQEAESCFSHHIISSHTLCLSNALYSPLSSFPLPPSPQTSSLATI